MTSSPICMSAATSPIGFTDSEDAYLNDANFKADISRKMRVPQKISMGEYDSDMSNGVNNWSNNYANMQVPERIMIAGQDQHIGTRAPPREIVLDNSILPTEPESVRVNTPPRVITLDKYPFPAVDEKDENRHRDSHIPVVKARNRFNDELEKDHKNPHRESSPAPLGSETLTTSDEILHLRRQMAKLNRRLMTLELDNLNRQQREKLIYGFGIAYFLLKIVVWLNKS